MKSRYHSRLRKGNGKSDEQQLSRQIREEKATESTERSGVTADLR
ncbi:MAG TPA: hypothetical protein VK057_11650 [Bacillota bacterium]|nr:hypothetical protein [Bacillota bacterium]